MLGGEREIAEEEAVAVAWSWGAGTDGQLGTGGTVDQHLPQPLFSAVGHVSLVACGGAHAIAIIGGRVLTWGRGSCGQLGHGDLENCLKPKPVEFLEQIVISYASAGWNHSGFISDSGCLYTCGDGSYGQLGHGNYQSHSSPTEVQFFSSKHAEQIACGMRHSLVLSKGSSEQLLCGFGSGRRGQLGFTVEGPKKCSAVPQVIHGLEDAGIVAVSANGDHSALLSANGHLFVWGRGFSSNLDSHRPQRLSSELKFVQVALGWNHALALTDSGEVFMVGGMLGIRHENLKQQVLHCSTPSNSSSTEACSELVPVKVAGFDRAKVVHIASGAEHSVLVTENETIMTWGWGEHGQLGLGGTFDRAIPQTVDLGPNPSSIRASFNVYCGSGFTVAIRKTTRSQSSFARDICNE